MSSLKLTLFGSPQVELNGARVELETRKALALLAYLVVTHQAHSRDTLTSIFWPESPQDRALANLRDTLYLLKKHLTDHWIDIRRQEVQIREDPTLWVDVLAFEHTVAQTTAHSHPSDILCEHCCTSLRAAIDLYRDDFLRGFTLPDCPAFDEWHSFQTDRLREHLAACFQHVLTYTTSHQDLLHAIEYAQRWIARGPWSEAAQRTLMRVYALDHQRSAALQQYQVCVQMLHEEFGAEPEQETQALYEAIVNDKLTPQFPHPNPPNNLPAQTTSFIGREAEVAAVVKLLSQPEVRLLTLTGAGGSGKTRLSVQVATTLLEHYADGVFFVALAPISDPDFVVPTIIVTVLGFQATGDTPPLEVLKTYLQSKRMLLVLDNFEQILAAAPVLNDLLTAAPAVKIVVTSRTVLRVSGEQEYLVPPLNLPHPTHLPSLERLTQSEAVQLFAARARAVHPEFTLNAENAPAVAEICTRLDGLPLAIELAAARVSILPPEKMLTRLGEPLDFLTGGARDLPARQQTLRNTIDWSYHLLDVEEQILFQRLAVFVGGWTLEAAEAVCTTAEAPSTSSGRTATVEGSGQVVDVLNTVQSLVDHNLVTHAPVNQEPRLTMLETIREYALERLAASGEEETIRQQHALFFLALAEGAEPYQDTVEQATWLPRLDVDYNNLRAALGWSIEHAIDIGLRLAGSLGRFWDARAYDREGRDWLAQALARSQTSGTGLDRWRAKALHAAGSLAWLNGDPIMARSLGEQSLALWRTLCDVGGIVQALQSLGLLEVTYGDHRRARILLEESIMLCRQIGDKKLLSETLWKYSYLLSEDQEYEHARASAEESLTLGREVGDLLAVSCALSVLGSIAMYQQDYSAAQSLFENSLKHARKSESLFQIMGILSVLGGLLDLQGHYEQASAYYAESLAIHQKRGSGYGAAWQLSGLGRVALHQQHWQAARTHFAEGLMLSQKCDNKMGIVACLIGLAGVVAGQGQTAQAAHILGAIAPLPEIPSRIFYKENVIIQREYDRILAIVRSVLGDEAFAATLAKGRALTLEQAIALALEGEQVHPDGKS